MKNILSFVVSLFYIAFYAQSGSCPDSLACNYDVTTDLEVVEFNPPINTGSNMNIGVISTLAVNLQTNDQIGAFILLGDGTYYCVGLSTYQGENTTVDVFGDDPLTVELDGCPQNEPLYFFVKREDSGQTYIYNTVSAMVDVDENPVDQVYISDATNIFILFSVESVQYQCEYPLLLYL